MTPPPEAAPPPKHFPWFRTALVLGGLTAGAIVYARYHPELPWCRTLDETSRPAIAKTCEAGSRAWNWAQEQWTPTGTPTPPSATPGADTQTIGSSGSTPANGTPQNDPDLPAMTVYFTPTESGSPAAVSRTLASLIRSAERSVLASYADFDDDDVAEALIAAHKTKGVTVEIGIDPKNALKPAVRQVIQAGVAVRTDAAPTVLPANFLVIDGQMVCYGSATPTVNSLCRDHHALFAIADRRLAAGFTDYFAAQYPGASSATRTGATIRAASPSDAALVVGGLQAYLTDDAVIARRVIEEISSADRTIQMLAPSLANDAIREALAKAAQRGVSVQVCLDRSAALPPEELLRLKNQRVELTRTTGPAVLGESILVIDRRTVLEVNGGWSAPGFKSRRSVGLLMRSRGIAGIFEAEFDRIRRNRPASPNGYAYELLRGHTVAPVLSVAP